MGEEKKKTHIIANIYNGVNHFLKFFFEYTCIKRKCVDENQDIIGVLIFKWWPGFYDVFTYGLDEFSFTFCELDLCCGCSSYE